MKKYILELSHREQRELGFKYDPKLNDYVYEFPVYLHKGKPSIICKLGIDEDNSEVWINVCDTTGRTYAAYYNRDYGKSKIIPVIDRNIEKELMKIDAKEVEEKIMTDANSSETKNSGNESETIRIKYFTDICELEYVGGGKSDWIDLRCAEDVEMKAGDFKLIPLGVAMELPKGYEAHVVPRSSTFKTRGIIQTNSIGIIDNSYCGDNDEWKMPVYATRDTIIHKNDRICQFRLVEKMPTVGFDEVGTLGNDNRGGFGSTGIE